MGYDKSVREEMVESGTIAAGTYKQSFKQYQEPNCTLEGEWNFGTTYKEVRGTAAAPVVLAAAGNFKQYYDSGSGATGTYRGIYQRLYLTGGAGGEAGRFFTTVSNNAPVDTVNGVHCSLSFGSAAGNVTGSGQAGKFTLHVPNRALTGTVSGVLSELYCDGASSTSSGNLNFMKFDIGGNTTGQDLVGVVANLFKLDGPAAMIGDTALVRTNTNAATHGIRCLINGTRYDVLISSAHS